MVDFRSWKAGGSLWLFPRLRSKRRMKTLTPRNRWVQWKKIKAMGQTQEFLGKKELVDLRQRSSPGDCRLEAEHLQRRHPPSRGSPFPRNRSLRPGSEGTLFPLSRMCGATEGVFALGKETLESHVRTGRRSPKGNFRVYKHK